MSWIPPPEIHSLPDDFQWTSYRSLVEDFLRGETNAYFKKKALHTTRYFKGEWFVSKKHQRRFYSALSKAQLTVYKANRRQVAVLFLLTAENPLWQMLEKNIHPPEFLPKAQDIEGVTTEQYALFQVAKSMAEREKYPHLAEISSETLIPLPTFSLILRGLLLEKHGAVLLGIDQ